MAVSPIVVRVDLTLELPSTSVSSAPSTPRTLYGQPFPAPTPARPPIICICGSTRFKTHWYSETKRLTYAGYIVLGVGDLDPNSTTNVPIDEKLKSKLDELHLRKIELADEVFILNVGGYIGSSTRNEIAHAQKLGKPIQYLEDIIRSPSTPSTPVASAPSTPESVFDGTYPTPELRPAPTPVDRIPNMEAK